MGPHLGYGDIIYDQPNKKNLNQKLKEFNIMLLLQSQVPSKGRLYNELDPGSPKYRHWFRKLCTFYKIKKTAGVPQYHNSIPQTNHPYNTGVAEDVTTF